MPVKRRKFGRLGIWLLAAPVVLCLLAVAVSALSNIGLPTRSTVVDHLTAVDLARLAEVTHLRVTLGGEVWPGWNEPDTPFIVYNEAYAFLVGYPAAGDPPAGWIRVPSGEVRGAAWEPVPGGAFDGQPYYRQPLAGLGYTPQAFTVLVGEHWTATFMTKEYAQVSFVSGLRAALPPVLRSVVPYRLMWQAIMGESEGYMAALLHESFHAFQGEVAEPRLAQAENVMTLEPIYPWDAGRSDWQAELNFLADAVSAATPEEAAALAAQFLAARDARRAAMGLSADLVDFERHREWLEGLAKYAELAGGRLAAEAATYAPVPAMTDDPDFNAYSSRAQFWDQQVGELRRVLNQEGEIRFYYTGFAQAAVLDLLQPGWKTRAFDEGVWLEDLLRAASAPPG